MMAAQVWCWGRGDLGQLGVTIESHTQVPVCVETLHGKDIVGIAAGPFNTGFITGEY